MVLIQHLFGILSRGRPTRGSRIRLLPLVFRLWAAGSYPHFATVSYAFCQRFPDELTSEIFEHILNKALNNRMLDTRAIFIDGTHIKASANKKKFQKEQVAKAAKVYSGQLRREVNMRKEKSWARSPLKMRMMKTIPRGWRLTGNRRKRLFHHRPGLRNVRKGEHERQFAYEAHTACDKHGFVLLC